VKAIVAVNNLGFIGLNEGLPWVKCKEDFSLFKTLTMNCSVIVGYQTYRVLPPLKGRTIVIDDRDLLQTDIDWCIGGKKTYEKYSPYLTEIHISHIDDNTIGDTTFPDLSKLNPNCKILNYYFNKIQTNNADI
jgi:dihydrofolate reductase